MDYSSISQHIQPSSGGRPTPPNSTIGILTPKIEPRDFIKLEPVGEYAVKLEPGSSDFEPLTRARSNTWPQPRPEEPPLLPHSAPPLPENDVMTPGILGFPKKSTSRRNAWGNMSYADLITQAIQSSQDKRLTLSQIYDWMVTNVSYFKDKGDSNSSAGWKNSIRHNLSLHNRFMRVQNEGTGKSSWWMLNPDAKPGKAARRRATSMETSKFEKKRGRIKKKIEAMRNGGSILDTPSPASSLSEGLDLFPESPHQVHNFNLSPSDFRGRTNSNASSCGGGGRLSPILGEVGDLHRHDSPGAPLSNWDYGNYAYGSTSLGTDRFGAEQLAVGLANTMKLQESGVSSYEFHQHQSYQSPQSFTGGGVQNGGYRRSPVAIPTTIKQSEQQQSVEPHLLNGIYGTTFINTQQASFLTGTNNHHLQQLHTKSMSSIHHSSELDFNLDLDPNSFECDVDEVLETEPGILREGIDFDDFGSNGAANLQQNQSVTIPCSTSMAPSPPQFQSHHHHHQQQTNGRQWTSVLHQKQQMEASSESGYEGRCHQNEKGAGTGFFNAILRPIDS